ncbi:MAG: hypothetical protein CM15mP39_10990 [Synechococcus sp.]|nr:MAG: hypothetical protein CM15mP39_10990 [Synechococcus sp.]
MFGTGIVINRPESRGRVHFNLLIQISNPVLTIA